MRLLRLTGLPAAAFLVLALLPLTAASATNGRPADPVRNGSTPAAARALTAVQAAFAPEGPAGRRSKATRSGNDVTMLLLDLRRHLGGLSPQDRRTAARYFARPTDGNEPFGASYGPRAHPTSDCAQAPHSTPRFCVHWARRTSDAPSSTDSDHDSIPNQVEKTRRIVGHVWHREVTRGGYRAPLKDGTRGGDGKLDVYLADIGGAGVYGYCVNERQVTGRAFYGYCVLDNDYSHREFPSNTPTQNLKVTAAHEFFHAVQFAYDAYEDPWFMESTATWMEDEVYDGINDDPLLPGRPARSRPPRRSLDFSTRAACTCTATGSSGATSPSGCPAPAGPACRSWCGTPGRTPTRRTHPGLLLAQGARPGARRPRAGPRPAVRRLLDRQPPARVVLRGR